MHTTDNSGKSIWWDLALEWLQQDDPALVNRLMKSGKLVEYLDGCARNASAVMDRYASRDVEEETAAEQLVSAMLPQRQQDRRERVHSGVARFQEQNNTPDLIACMA